jgi:hypothetical protein
VKRALRVAREVYVFLSSRSFLEEILEPRLFAAGSVGV